MPREIGALATRGSNGMRRYCCRTVRRSLFAPGPPHLSPAKHNLRRVISVAAMASSTSANRSARSCTAFP
jgi:hypothetical protein